MLAEMGQDVEANLRWQSEAAAWFTRQLRLNASFAAVVIEEQQMIIACAAGQCESHAPSPENPTGWVGQLFNVVTHPRVRGRGHARRAVVAVLDWFDRETEVPVVRLNSTDIAVPLYQSLGFAEPSARQLRRERRDTGASPHAQCAETADEFLIDLGSTAEVEAAQGPECGQAGYP